MKPSETQSVFDLADHWGPEKVVHIYHAESNLRAIVVIDNIACGPAIGGTRMASDVSLDECARLARAMTLKNAAAGLPHGGAKSVIFEDPKVDTPGKEAIVRGFATAIAQLTDYIPGPDMGTNEQSMAWVHDEIGRAVGLPREIGGIPLDEIGATGLGVAVAAEIAQDFCNFKIDGARVAVQGFGAVGQHAARFLLQQGAYLVAASDSRGTIVNQDGLNFETLVKLKKSGHSVTDSGDTESLSTEAIVGVDCDIWIPAARPDVLHKDNAGELKAKLVVQGANIPATEEAEQILHARGILSIPDFIANAGGVICASVEYHGGSEQTALEVIREKVERNTRIVLANSQEQDLLPRTAAEQYAQERVSAAREVRRWR